MTVIEVTPIRGGSKPAQKKLRALIRKVKNPTPANREVSVWLHRWLNNNFKSEGGNVQGWLPFKHGGRIKGGVIDRNAKLLQDTGRLKASFSHFYGRTFAGNGSELSYSITHELGLPHKNLPARRMLPLANDIKVEKGIIRIYDRWIRRMLK